MLRILFILMVALAAPAAAQVECCLPGQPSFWVGLSPDGAPAADGSVHVVLAVGGLGSGHVRLAVPAELRVLSGPVEIDFEGPENRAHTLVLGPGREGGFALRAALVFRDHQGVTSNGELELPGVVRGGAISFGSTRTVCEERIVNSRRQRYGGSFMVPLSDDEPAVTESDLRANGRAPAVLRRVEPKCPACPTGAWPDSLQWVVFTDERGHVRECEPIQAGPADSLRVAAMRRALHRWTFAPAELDGRTVSDWIVVRLSIAR